MWKSLKSSSHPTQWSRRNDTNPERRTRAADANQLNEAYGGKILTSTFVNDAAKLWNKAPDGIKQSDSVYSAKKNKKIHCQSPYLNKLLDSFFYKHAFTILTKLNVSVYLVSIA